VIERAILGMRATVVALMGALACVPLASAHQTHLLTFHLHGTNGYRIRVDASGAPGSVIPGYKPFHLNQDKGAVTVTVAKGPVSAAYSVPAIVTRTRIKARLRGFGRIAAKFHPRVFRSKGSPKRGVVCSDLQVTTDGGFRGHIRFRGEHGYTKVKRHSAPGGIGYQDSGCQDVPGGPAIQLTELVAKSETIRFVALGDVADNATGFLGSERVKNGRVLINRQILRFTRGSTEFSFDQGLTAAHVGPRGPLFSGSADFAAPNTWAGDLAASFPGKPNVPLTGPEFTAKLKSIKLKRSPVGEGP
jgi:hypothetical protein